MGSWVMYYAGEGLNKGRNVRMCMYVHVHRHVYEDSLRDLEGFLTEMQAENPCCSLY